MFTTTSDLGNLHTEISNTTVVVSGIEHDQVEEGTNLECPPDAKIVVLARSALETLTIVKSVPCQLGCRESQD